MIVKVYAVLVGMPDTEKALNIEWDLFPSFPWMFLSWVVMVKNR